MYRVKLLPSAEEDMIRLRRSEPKAFNKALDLLDELMEHPRTGTGHPEPLSGDRAGQWSRRITRTDSYMKYARRRWWCSCSRPTDIMTTNRQINHKT